MSDLNENFLISKGIDSIFFKIDPDSLSLTKDPMLRENWIYTAQPLKKNRSREGLAGDNIYTFQINDNDIN